MMGCLGVSSDGAKGFVWRVWAGQGGVGEEVIAFVFQLGVAGSWVKTHSGLRWHGMHMGCN